MIEEQVINFFIGHFNYWLFVILMMTGMYIVVAKNNLLKKMIGLNLFQTAVFLLYISMGKIHGATAPIFTPGQEIYSNPLPHVLILTAIVVGVATTALGLALIVRLNEIYNTIEDDEIIEIEKEMEIDEYNKINEKAQD